MADNIEKDAANSMANSDKYGGFTKMRNLTNILTGKNNNSRSSGNTSGSGTGTGTGNGWTAEDYKNYGDWQKSDREHQHLIDSTTAANNHVLENSSLDAHHIRTKDMITHAAQYGQVGNVSPDANGRTGVTFRAAPARTRAAGYGAGAQGSSKQQTSGKGAKIGATVGTALGALVPGAGETGVSEVIGNRVGAKVGDAIEKKIVNRKSKAGTVPGKTAAQAGAKAGTKPGMTAGEAATVPAKARTSRAKKA
jgi:hypothetical protein